jgi:hypothetical protein
VRGNGYIREIEHAFCSSSLAFLLSQFEPTFRLLSQTVPIAHYTPSTCIRQLLLSQFARLHLQWHQKLTQDPATAEQTPSLPPSPHPSTIQITKVCQKPRLNKLPFINTVLTESENSVINCNCTVCFKNGYLLTFVSVNNVTWTQGSLENLTCYEFNRKTLQHYFCPVCGTSVLAKSGDQMGLNVRSLNDVDLDKLNLKHYDGKSL